MARFSTPQVVIVFILVVAVSLTFTIYDLGPVRSMLMNVGRGTGDTSVLQDAAGSSSVYVGEPNGEWDYHKFAAQFACSGAQWCDTFFADSPSAQSFLYKHQHPEDCTKAKFLVMPHEWVAGLGSSIHVKSFFLGLALEEQRVLILPENISWLYGRACFPEPISYECYFEPITNCRTSLHAKDWESAPLLESVGQHNDKQVVRLNDDLGNEGLLPKGFNFSRYVPTVFAHKGLHWWHAQAATYLIRPNARTKEIVAREQKKMFPPDGKMPHPIVSMHIRHGDKAGEAELFSLDAHMQQIIELAPRYHIKHIMIGTEDEKVIEQAANDRKYCNFTFHWVEEKRNASIHFFYQAEYMRGEILMNVSLANLYLQAQGDIFVGTRTSNWARLVDELRKTSGRARIPYYTPERPHQFDME